MTTKETETQTYCVFTRTWWKEATSPGWPNNLEPQAGTRSYRGHPTGLTYAEAQEYCKEWNEEHDPGRYSRKAEFEEQMNNLQKRAHMILRDAITKAVADGNAAMAGRIADTLRFKFGMNYAEIAAAFNKACGINAADFEILMYNADTYE